MGSVNYLAVVVAAVAAFVAALGYYVAFGAQLQKFGSAAAEQERPSPWLAPVELLRHLIVAAVVAALAVAAGLTTWTSGLLLGLGLWVGFPVVLLAGSVFHEKVPWRLAALHAGDWLLKLLIVGTVVAAWR
ncbi:MAG: DUF1761 domain-containing protein [Dehalococcoidia bacterium]